VKIVFQLARIDNFGNLDPNVVSDGTYGSIQYANASTAAQASIERIAATALSDTPGKSQITIQLLGSDNPATTGTLIISARLGANTENKARCRTVPSA
jgi:hypothetical protein